MKIADTSGQDVYLPAKSNRAKWLSLVGVITVAIVIFATMQPALSSWSSSDAAVSVQRIRTAVVERGDLLRDLSVQGQVVAAISPRLYATGQGTITFEVDAGDSVKKGQVLASIDSPELTNQLQQEQASLQQMQLDLERQKIQAKKQALLNTKTIDMAKVALTAADREKRRADKAYAANTINQIDFEKAQDDLQNAQLIYSHAERDAELNAESLAFEVKTTQLKVERQALLVDELTRKVEELTLRSPVDGIVGNLAVKQKNQVSRNQPILSVVDLSEFELEVEIPESYADDLAIGMDAEVLLNGEAHAAKLVTISPEIENNQVTGRVRFTAPTNQQPEGLRQNQRLTTRIIMESKANVLKVQRGPFLEASSGRFAYVVKDNLAVRTDISTGARSLSAIEITDGLNIGDRIIISGVEQFNGAEQVLITD